LNYLNREQYGSRPILYGESFNSVMTATKERDTWIEVNGRYVKSELNPEVEYEPQTLSFMPRMHSRDNDHKEAYQQWVKIKGRQVHLTDEEGKAKQIIIPTFAENMEFLAKYQFGFMYLRYFMWNFAGRQNDVQGSGNLLNGNWLSGISAIDQQVAGPQKNLPSSMKENKGRNTYYFLPLILGILGLIFQYRHDRQNFLSIGLLFFLMSFALVVYLNEVPNTPRERDYVYVGSFYAFCIWIGLGVLSVYSLLLKIMKEKIASASALTICLLASPVLLISENYDDHDRSGRYSARDLARNYLESCEKNAILFTHADNDTYPLWYCQEVEGIRKDVRVVVMPYLQAEWYIEQLQRKIYANEGLKMSIPLAKYQSSELNYVYIVPQLDTEQKLDEVLGFVASDSSHTKLTVGEHENISYIPVNKVKLENPNQEPIHVELNQRGMTKGALAFWDIIVSNRGKRPICFTAWSDPEEHGLKDNLIFDGLVYRLTDQKTQGKSVLDMGKVDSSHLYTILMEKCNWDNLENPNVYFDWHHRRMFASMQIRNAFYRLASQLTREQQTQKALKVLKKAEQTVSLKLWPVDYQSVLMAGLYAKNGDTQTGKARINELARSLEEWLAYYASFPSSQKSSITNEAGYQFALYDELIKQASGTLSEQEINQMKDKLLNYAQKLG
ncbi:MAG: hypothetical protein ACM3O8_01405, partial [Methylococcaceae bacterium]